MSKKPNKAIFDPAAKMNRAKWRFETLTLTLDDILCMYIHDKGSIYANKPKIGQKNIFWLKIQRGGKFAPPRLEDDFQYPGWIRVKFRFNRAIE